MKKIKMRVLALSVLVLTGSAFIEETELLNSETSFGKYGWSENAIDTASKNFVVSTAIANLIEVRLSTLAEKKAANPRIRRFARTIIKDHTAIENQLKTLAKDKGIVLPTSLPKKRQFQIDRLKGLSATLFDREFLKIMIADHKKVIALFTRASKIQKDAQLRAFAYNTIPILKSHADSARAINEEVSRYQ